ncbi:hypothetical protein RGQ29_017610 [Quercus rubra]|uniref:Histidine-containing phosphotransfer protein n=1 Tax=Quercus rubra TaxID=3512 RepID=A0AAN7J142_QUERU|nr:hypothetical protein RGQ29_017610 [Quercus rubra]
MASNSLQQQIASMRQSLFDEGILDRQHFIQVEYLEDGDDPNFVKDYIGVYLSDSLKNINAIEQALEAKSLDVVELEKCLELLKDDCLNIGDQKVADEVEKMLQCCKGADMEGARTALSTVKQEYNTLRSKLEAYHELLEQRAAVAPKPPGKRKLHSLSGNKWYVVD